MKKQDFGLYGIVGHPLGHTLSPAMQEAAFAARGIKAFYLTLDFEPSEFKRLIGKLSQFSVDGLNVTVPYKETVASALKHLTPEAKAIGAVNTIFRKGKKWFGANTDAVGFSHALAQEGRFRTLGKTALIFGAGGSARAVLYALGQGRIKKVIIANRTLGRAQALRKRFAPLFKKTEIVVCGLQKQKIKAAVREADLVVNTTSLGLRTNDRAVLKAMQVPRSKEAGKKMFFDLIYKPATTPFLKLAKSRGHQTLNGLGMLASQGAKSFEYWTRKKAPLHVMRRVLVQGLKAAK